MARPSSVTVTEVGPRDGFQSESEYIDTDIKTELVNDLIGCGVPRIEVSSFVSPRAVPQLKDAEKVFADIDRSSECTLAALVPNVKGALRAVEAGVDEMVVFVSASESHNSKNVNRSIDESLDSFEEVVRIAENALIRVHGDIATAFGCPFEGDVSVEKVGYVAKRYQELGINSISLGDTTGMATPPIVSTTCQHLAREFPELSLTLHFHNTRGIGLANVIAGLDEGIAGYEASFGGIGGCPFAPKATGNICTEDLVYLLQELGIETGIDLVKLCDIARVVETVVDRELPGQVMKAGMRLDLHPFEDARTAVG